MKKTKKKYTIFIKLLIGLLLFNNLIFSVFSQTSHTITSLGVGDKLPEEVWSLKHQTLDGKIITLSDYKDKKLIILDFWATWCGACIGLLPKMDSLQREFVKDLLILPVTTESTEVISTFFSRRNNLNVNKSQLTYITRDESLSRLFPYSSLPQYVWIKDGEVYAISEFDAVSRDVIKKLMMDEKVFIQTKGHFVLNYDKSEPLFFKREAIRKAELIHQSTFVRYLEGLSLGWVSTVGLPNNSFRVEDTTYRRITARNQTMIDLFQLSFSKNNKYFSLENTIVRSKNREKLTSSAVGVQYLTWLRDGNSYCYELIIPTQDQHKAWDIMQNELHQYFDKYVAYLEKQIVPSLCLVRTSDVDKIRSKGGEKINTLDGMGGRINQYKLSLFAAIARDKGLGGLKKPVINLTNYPYPVDLEINAKMHDIEDLNRALAKYDLKFVEMDQEVEVLVIDDKIPQ